VWYVFVQSRVHCLDAMCVGMLLGSLWKASGKADLLQIDLYHSSVIGCIPLVSSDYRTDLGKAVWCRLISVLTKEGFLVQIDIRILRQRDA
jgi:hypothetical protein